MKHLLYLYGLLALLLAPFHVDAQGGNELPWNTDRSPELGKLLRELNNLYGADTVSLLSWLNDASIHHKRSVLTATVRIDGKETHENISFLIFKVETGVIFNTQTTDQAQRLADLWEQVVARALSHFETFTVPTDGIMIDLLSHCKAFAEKDELAEHVDEPGPVEEVKFYFPGGSLREYLGKKLSAHALLTRATVFVNGQKVVWAPPDKPTRT
ncbi:MAG: hypothetical protein FJ147_22050 [Deltaproteobacteria bacterium]|nr:hypothetical protein [Deltaproteobacteria bacterium]